MLDSFNIYGSGYVRVEERFNLVTWISPNLNPINARPEHAMIKVIHIYGRQRGLAIHPPI